MKRKIITIGAAILVFVLALFITLYPVISNYYNERHQSEIHTQYMEVIKQVDNSNLIHAKELADLAMQLEKAGSHSAYEQVMAAVSDFEKGNMRLSVVLASLK